jgi:hypothetical protein
VLAPFWARFCNLGAIIVEILQLARPKTLAAPRNPCRAQKPLPRPETLAAPRNPCRAAETLAAPQKPLPRPEPLAAPQNLLQPAALTAQRNPDCTEKPRLHGETGFPWREVQTGRPPTPAVAAADRDNPAHRVRADPGWGRHPLRLALSSAYSSRRARWRGALGHPPWTTEPLAQVQ